MARADTKAAWWVGLALLLGLWTAWRPPAMGPSPPVRQGGAQQTPNHVNAALTQGARRLPAVRESTKRHDVTAVEAARAWRDGKRNIFFDRAALVAGLAEAPRAVAALQDLLAVAPSAAELPENVNWALQPPGILTERMAAIDLLEALAARGTPQAFEALRQMAAAEPPAVDAVAARVLQAERLDAVTALARLDAVQAFATVRALSLGATAQGMGDALVAGLVDTGVPRDEALALVREAQLPGFQAAVSPN